MARRNVVQKSSLDLSNPYYAALSDAIDKFQAQEEQFYKDRRDELNSYPGLSGLGNTRVEDAYDALLGDRPWNYTSIFNNAGNNPAVETDNTEDDDGDDIDSFYVLLPDSLESISDKRGVHNYYALYNPGTGQSGVDLLFTDISFFKSGSTGNDDDDDDSFSYKTGFGEVPIAYQSNSKLSGRLAHMYRLIGSKYDSSVGPKYSTYVSARNNYENSSGSGNNTDFFSGSVDRPWQGFVGDTDAGYNRPDKLEFTLVLETRGAN
tara:strand:- start:5624 stop:6412 length:789 start_codon:yes stop_codon:yes gene_type:complete